MIKLKEINRAYLSLGSNISAEKNLLDAVRLLSKYGKLLATSSVWESGALGEEDQPNYLNAAVLLETPLSAEALRRHAIPHIENALGRVRHPHDPNAPRTMDIDIMLFNRDIISLNDRHIPDAEIMEREFVARALAEIDPDYVHPETGQTLSEIACGFLAERSSLKWRNDMQLTDVKGI